MVAYCWLWLALVWFGLVCFGLVTMNKFSLSQQSKKEGVRS
jgi:hypothetical protein